MFSLNSQRISLIINSYKATCIKSKYICLYSLLDNDVQRVTVKAFFPSQKLIDSNEKIYDIENSAN